MKILLSTILLIILQFSGAALSMPSNSNMRELAHKFASSDSEEERMAICINLIDLKIVRRGCQIVTIDQAFGTTLSKRIPRKGQPMEKGTVDFVKQKFDSRNLAVSVGHTGWYLAVEYDSNGAVQNYYLSNLHK